VAPPRPLTAAEKSIAQLTASGRDQVQTPSKPVSREAKQVFRMYASMGGKAATFDDMARINKTMTIEEFCRMFKELKLLPKHFKVDACKALFVAGQKDDARKTLTPNEFGRVLYLCAKHAVNLMNDADLSFGSYPPEIRKLLELAGYDSEEDANMQNRISPSPDFLSKLASQCENLFKVVDVDNMGELKGPNTILYCGELVKAMMGEQELGEDQVERGAALLAEECGGVLDMSSAQELVTGLVSQRCAGVGEERNKAWVKQVCDALRKATLDYHNGRRQQLLGVVATPWEQQEAAPQEAGPRWR